MMGQSDQATECAFIATAEPWLGRIFRLRHSRYVLDQGKAYPGADNDQLTLIDREDKVSRQLAYRSGAKVVAALRQTQLCDIGQDSYLAGLVQATPKTCKPDSIVCSRFVMAAQGATLRANVSLFRLAYDIGRQLGVRHSILSTRADLVPLFTAFGFRVTGGYFSHPISGHQHVMILDLANQTYLEHIKSPLARIGRADVRHEATP